MYLLHRTRHHMLLSAALACSVGGVGGLMILQSPNPLLVPLGLVGLFSAGLILKKPELGLTALVFMTYIRLSDVLIQEHGLPSLAKVFVPMLLCIVLVRWLVLHERPLGWEGPLKLILVYGVVLSGSLLFTTNLERTQDELVIFGKDVLIVLAVVLLLQRGTDLQRVIWALIGAGIFMCSITVIQQITGTFDFNYWGFGKAPVKHIVGQASGYRASGNITPNAYARILVVLVPLSLDRLWHGNNLKHRIIAGWALTVCILAMVFTFSRSGFLGLIAVLGLMFLVRPPRLWMTLTTIIALLLLWQLAPESYRARIATLNDALSGNVTEEVSFRGRLSEVTVAVMVFAENPVTGVGYGDFKSYYQKYAQRLGLETRLEGRGAHNLYLEVAAETGLLGLITFGAILWAIFQGIWKTKKRFTNAQQADLANMIIAFGIGMIGYLTISFFQNMVLPRFFWLLIGIGLAIPQVASYELGRKQSVSHLKNPTRA